MCYVQRGTVTVMLIEELYRGIYAFYAFYALGVLFSVISLTLMHSRLPFLVMSLVLSSGFPHSLRHLDSESEARCDVFWTMKETTQQDWTWLMQSGFCCSIIVNIFFSFRLRNTGRYNCCPVLHDGKSIAFLVCTCDEDCCLSTAPRQWLNRGHRCVVSIKSQMNSKQRSALTLHSFWVAMLCQPPGTSRNWSSIHESNCRAACQAF
jgi:hypothetical protein